MGNIFDLIRGLFSNIFGFIIIIAGLQWLYRNVINARREPQDETTMLSMSSRTTSKFDMGTLGSTGRSDVMDISSSERGRIAFTEKDMYQNVIEETMTYSANGGESYDNPKELYEAGLLTFREYIKMVPNRKRGGN